MNTNDDVDDVLEGFNPRERSFWVLEGLLMYLPPSAPETLRRHVRDDERGSAAAGGPSSINTHVFFHFFSAQLKAQLMGTRVATILSVFR